MEHHHHRVPKPVHHAHQSAHRKVEHRVEHRESKARMGRDILLFAAALVIVFLIALTIFSFVTKPKAPAGMIYLYPTDCSPDTCNPAGLASFIKASITPFKADFIKTPALLVSSGDTLRLVQADTKEAIASGLCNIGYRDFCLKASPAASSCGFSH